MFRIFARRALVLCLFTAGCGSLLAQECQNTIGAKCEPPVPNAPSHALQSRQNDDGPPKPTRKRVLLADDPYVPLTSHQKLMHFVRSTYSPYTFASAAFSTEFSWVTGGRMYDGGGGTGWAKQFGSSVADTEARRFFGYSLFPILLHQDPRYLPKRKGSILSRLAYSASRVVFTRTDSGHTTFNSSELLAVAFSRALQNAYYPDRYRGGSETLNRIESSFYGDAQTYIINEFQPDFARLFRRHAPKKIQDIEEKLPVQIPGLNEP